MTANEKKEYNLVIARCCAIIREEINKQKDAYKRMAPVMDKVTAENPAIDIMNVQQAQWDARKSLWENVFKEYLDNLQNLLNILNKEIKKDDSTQS